MTKETDIRMIPLDQLYLHAINPRQDVPDEDVEAIAHSIAINGLMQNLSGFQDPSGDGIGIVAGGRRLRALVQLAAGNWSLYPTLVPIDPVPVQVTSDQMLAQSWALAENVTHAALHPADEIRAYRAMEAQGSDINIIARAFAKTEAHVRRRLSLAALPDQVLDALRAGRISLDAAKAMTVANDPARVIEVLAAIEAGELHPSRIKDNLAPNSIPATDRRAVYVGLDTYRAEGGALTDDLFTEIALLHDEAILNTLFEAKLQLATEQVQEDEGWSWARHTIQAWVDWDLTEPLRRLHKTSVDLPAADAKELEDLKSLETDELSEESQNRLRTLRDRAAGDFTDEDREAGGVFVYVDNGGQLIIDHAFAEKSSKAGGSSSKSGGGEKPVMPENCRDDLRRVQLMAMQTALLGKTELLLDILAWQFETGAASYRSPLQITVSPSPITPEKDSNCHIDARLTAAEDTNLSAEFTIDALEIFQAKGKKRRNAMLTAGLARSLSGLSINGSARALLQIVTPQIRKHWTPDAANYFGRIRADLLDVLWAEMLEIEAGDDRIAEFGKLKKAQKAKELEALFTDASVQEAHGLSRAQIATIDAWLPEEISAPTGEKA